MRRGGLGKNPDLSLFCVTPCGLTGDRNNGNRTTVTRNVTKEKQPICEAEQMRKIVRYRKNSVPEPEQHPNGGRCGSRRKQAAT